MGILINCSNPSCKKEIERSPCHLKRTKNLFCGNECRIEFMKGRGTGKDNPNYGKKWGKERREKQSEIIKSKVDEKYREDCAKGMKGRSVAEETKIKRRETLLEKYGRLSNTLSLSEEAKKKIGEKSSQKFTKEFQEKFYQTMVERGHWIAKENLDPYKFYRGISNWDYNVLAYEVKGQELVKDLGFYNGKTNKNGLVRDHRFSRKSGFDFGVFPEILKHPVNCEFIKHGDNIRKRQSKNINSDSLSLEDLFNLIRNYKKDYPHQDICISKINSYLSGERYEMGPYIYSK